MARASSRHVVRGNIREVQVKQYAWTAVPAHSIHRLKVPVLVWYALLVIIPPKAYSQHVDVIRVILVTGEHSVLAMELLRSVRLDGIKTQLVRVAVKNVEETTILRKL